MCNTCGCPNCRGNNNNGRNSHCGCCNLLNEFANALNNFFTDPCDRHCNCGCGNNNAWRNGFRSGWDARGNNNGCGCGGNRSRDLSGYTDCGNYDSYYARQYGLCSSGCSCNL